MFVVWAGRTLGVFRTFLSRVYGGENTILSYLQKRLIPVRTNVKMRILLPDFHTFLSLALLGKICLSFKKKLSGYRIVSLVTIIHR